MSEQSKPECKDFGADGNIFAVLGQTTRTLKRARLRAQAEECSKRVFSAKSYDEALGICMEYVDPA